MTTNESIKGLLYKQNTHPPEKSIKPKKHE